MQNSEALVLACMDTLAAAGAHKAVALHYYSGRRVAPRTITRLAKNWQPWRSVATWYLWRSLEPVPVEY